MTELYDTKWHLHYEKLVEFKQKNGNCLVPKRYQEDVSLGNWVAKQRKFHLNNKLRLDREGLLEEIGFVWRVDRSASDEFESTWKKQYEKLVEFKRNNGHCLVPKKYPEDKSLGEWVSYQRQMHTNDKLRVDREGLLDEIGFVWKVDKCPPPLHTDDPKWKNQYENLVEFKRKHGNCLVPKEYPEDKSLGRWVSRQRLLHSKNTIRLDRKGLLDELGFTWKVRTVAARSSTTDDSDSDSEASSSSVGPPTETLEEAEPERGHVRNRFACPSPNRKRPRTRLAASEQMAARTNPRYGAIGSSPSSVEKDGGREEEDSKPSPKPSPVTSNSALVASYPDQKDSEVFSVGLPDETLLEETEPERGHVRNRFACPSPNRKRSTTRLAKSEQKAARTNPRGGAIDSCPSSVEKDGGRDEEDLKSCLYVKLEPDC